MNAVMAHLRKKLTVDNDALLLLFNISNLIQFSYFIRKFERQIFVVFK